MADLGDELYRAISRRSPHTEPETVADALAWFLKQTGGNVAGAARLAGVPRRSFRDWLAGTSKPKGGRGGELVDAARKGERRRRLRPGREKRLRKLDPSGITMAGTYQYDSSTRDPINIGPYLDPNLMNNLIDAYLSGAGTDEMRQIFADAATGDASGFYSGSLALPPSDEHGWDISSVDLTGGDQDE